MLEYINRRKESHFLISKPTKYGKERYYIVKNKEKFNESDFLTEIPRGYEFYEFPEDGRVVLRKITKSNITQDEVEIANDVMKNHLTAKDYIIDKTNDSLIIYVAHLSEEEFFGFSDNFHLIQTYNAKLKFEKLPYNQYASQRFCYLSRNYGWITMETSEDLAYLMEKYCFHIDKESLLDFWIEGVTE